MRETSKYDGKGKGATQARKRVRLDEGRAGKTAADSEEDEEQEGEENVETGEEAADDEGGITLFSRARSTGGSRARRSDDADAAGVSGDDKEELPGTRSEDEGEEEETDQDDNVANLKALAGINK